MSDRTRHDGDLLARRYERLLKAYPKAWRASRGEEMLGTLLDAAGPGQLRPSLRESASIAVQGLRERFDLRRRRTTGTVWAQGLRIGALVLLGQALASAVVVILELAVYLDAPPAELARYAVALPLGIAAMAALTGGRTIVAAVLTGLWIAVPAGFGGVSWQIVTAFVILAGLSIAGRGQGRQRTPAVWVVVAPLVVALWVTHHLVTGGFFHPADGLVYPFALLLAVTAGVLLDPRLPIAAACLTVVVALNTTLHVPGLMTGDTIGEPAVRVAPATMVFAAVAVGLLTIGHLRARRLARI